MGFALAEECARRGAQVILICGPVALHSSHPNIQRIDVVSASEMHHKALAHFPNADAGILCAAVADYTPANPETIKIKRKSKEISIELVSTKDIAANLGAIKSETQTLVGFALETNNAEENALGKLQKKNLDFIVLNSLENPGAGFQTDTNKITILDKDGSKLEYDLKQKTEVASDIIDHLENSLQLQTG